MMKLIVTILVNSLQLFEEILHFLFSDFFGNDQNYTALDFRDHIVQPPYFIGKKWRAQVICQI